MKKMISFLLASMAMLLLAGCGQTAPANVPESAAQISSSVEKIDAYPVTVTSYDGQGQPYEQTFDKAPERILCNQPQAVQLLLKLGLKDKIVAASRSVGDVGQEYKADFESLNIISDNDSPQKEVVLAQQPDIIIGWGSTFGEKGLGDVSDWNTRGIHTYIMENTASNTGNRTVDRLYTDIEKLGIIFGVQERAQEVIKEMKATVSSVNDIVSNIPQEQRPNVLTVQQVYENEFFGRAKTDLTSNLIELAGGNSLDEEFGKQSLENLIKLNPDVILIINRIDTPADGKIQSLINNPSLATIPAIANQRFVVVDYVDFYGGNAETPNTVKKISKELFPKEFEAQHYPVTVSTYNQAGEVVELTFDKAPERVISVSQANTELLVGLGLGDRIIATAHRTSTPYEKTRQEYEALNFLAADAYPSKEVVLSLEPDLIVGWGSLFAEKDLGPTSDWNGKGINTYLMKNTVSGLGQRTMGDLLEDIKNIGLIFNIEDKTNQLLSDIEGRLSAIKEKSDKIPQADRPTILTVQIVYENEFFARAKTDLSANIIDLAGGVCLDEEYGKHSMEVLLQKNPDYILIIDRETNPAQEIIAALKANPTLQSLNAIKNDHFFILDHASFYCGSMRTIEDIEKLSEMILGEEVSIK